MSNVVVENLTEDVHNMMPSFSLDLLEILLFVKDGWTNYSVKHISRTVDYDEFIKHILKFTGLILDKKFKYDDCDLLKMLQGVTVTKESKRKEYCNWLIGEITILYKVRSTNRKKFMIFVKEFLTEMMDNEERILSEKYGLVSISEE